MSSESGKKAIGIFGALIIAAAAFYFQGVADDASDSAHSSSGTYSGLGFSGDPAVLTQAESQALSDRLSAAYKAQHICYGWVFNDSEIGSNWGPSTPVTNTDRCDKYVVLTVDYTYNSVDEEFTAVTYDIESVGVTLDKAELTAAGIDDDELLDEPNVAVSNAVGLLPVLVAEKGQAPAVPVPEGQQDTKGATVERTFDLQWLWLVLAIILLGGGLAWVIVGLVRGRRSAREEPLSEERPDWLPPIPPQPQQQPEQPKPQQGNDQGMGSQ